MSFSCIRQIAQINLYIGSTKIGKVYKGSTLVYSSSGGGESIPITLLNTPNSLAILGNLGPNKIYALSEGRTLYSIESINGNIGESGSSIYAGDRKASYKTKLTDSEGRLFYVYTWTVHSTNLCYYVSPKQEVGDKIPRCSNFYGTTNSDATSITCTKISGSSPEYSIDRNVVIDYYTYRA